MYRSKDFNNILLSIDKIKDKAAEKYKTNYEPTLTENYDVCFEIKKFIIEKNRIVYGGIAQNLLIEVKNKKDCFYADYNGIYYNWPNIADIEFYSTTPINDIIDLCEILFKKGFNYIEAKEGIHGDTYKLFVNFVNYCDISYLPQNIYNNIPTTKIKKLRCVNTHFMVIDAFRILTDPLTSYWRLDKVINRFQKLLYYYNYDKKLIKKKINYIENINIKNIILYIKDKIIVNSKLIVVGYYAYNYYISMVSKSDIIINIPYYEVITESLINDGDSIYKILKNKYNNKINIKEYYPFYEFLDNKIEFYYENNLILILYGNNNRCTLYNYNVADKIYLGTYNLTIMYYLINYYLYLVNKIYYQAKIFLTIVSKLHYFKMIYLNKKNISVLDESPFKDFTLDCHGTPHEQIRESRLKMITNKKNKRFIYVPTGVKKYINISHVNISGTQIFDNKYKIFK